MMFALEAAAGIAARSVALQADALDFLGDSANYAISLFVLGMAPAWRSRAALIKALSMGAFGVWVMGSALARVFGEGLPHAPTMSVVGALALLVNVAVALMLYRFRSGDSNMRSVWLCTRNDAIGNLAVLAAALGVFGTGTSWPDLAVAAVMATLALMASVQVARAAMGELGPRAWTLGRLS